MWHISVQGSGPHHNKDYPKDVDRLAEQFVLDLQGAGHQIDTATITFGGRQSLITVPPAVTTQEGK